jgi:Fe-S oxidoreductase
MDERHSTRGRGNALRMAISGQLHNTPGQPAWADPETIETLHLCLSCKACKSECPSNVDIARLKAEYTAQRYRHTGDTPLSARLFGHVRNLNQLGSIMPDIANWVSSFKLVRRVLDEVLNLAPQRSLPPFATSLYRWFSGHPLPVDHADRPKVVLFADCFVTYNEPQIGQAAVAVLEKLGYHVLLPKVGCCGRAMISNGLLDDAIRSGDKVVEQLRPFVEDPRVRAIVVCEPSCLSVMKDEWQQLRMKSDRGLRRRLGEKAMLVEEFVERQWDAHPARPEVKGNGQAVFHGHCHQKALWGEDLTAAALKRVLGNGLKVLPSGCCGMAGAFGYTKDRYDLSMKIGKLSVFDAVNEITPDTQIIAGGTSCRHQIRDGTHREALHPIEVIARALT